MMTKKKVLLRQLFTKNVFIPFDYLNLMLLMGVEVVGNHWMVLKDFHWIDLDLMMDLKQFVNERNVEDLELFFVV